MSVLDAFHPAVAAWFSRTFDAPTEAQIRAWPALAAGEHVLVAAPTGSGKTFAAFLSAIDQLVKEGLQGPLPDETRVVYVSPLKALSNDIQRNLEAPLQGIREELVALGLPDVEIRAVVRTGDTTQSERAGMRRRAPHIVVTTPESLYILLGSQSGRDMLATCRTVIVDEIHAIAGNKRGAHLALSLERLQALTGSALTRVGLSATQKPIEEVAKFLTGARPVRCTIVDSGHVRRRDLALEVPPAPLEAVMSGEVWTQVYDRLASIGVGASHHAGVRQYAPHGGADCAASVRTRGRGKCRRASRQLVEGAPPECRTALEARRPEGAGGHSFVGAGHRYRRCGPGVSNRLDPLHQLLPAAGGPRGAFGRRHLQRQAVSRCPATNWWSAPRCSRRSGAASSTGSRSRRMRSTYWRNKLPRKCRHANGRRTVCSR